MLDAMRMQPVTGSHATSIYPYIRKIDLMSSNSYIISGHEQIALIDPGGLDEQIDHIEEVVESLQDELLRPVIVYLTHVHMDHWVSLKQGRKHRNLDRAALAVQVAGAEALENADLGITLSSLLGRTMIKAGVDLKLLAPMEISQEGSYRRQTDRGIFDYSIKSMETSSGLMLHSQVIPLGKGDCLEIYHSPGHSPDSICMQIGSLLIVGDLFFAPNPGMAGACGWSREDLMQSIQKVLWILENKNIQLCCSGHGRPIDSWTARKTLEVMYTDTCSLQNLETITPEWARRTADYAYDLMAEMERISTIISGRLAFIAHVLNELEESSEADLTEALLDPNRLDAIFSDFNGFSTALREGKKISIDLVHKAGQAMGRLERLFEIGTLSSIMDPSILGRAGRLINDYSMTYRGFRPPYYVSYEDINRIVGESLRGLKDNRYDEEAILQAESEEDYLLALKARIAHLNLFENVNLAFEPDPNRPFARMDRERFTDALMDIIERFRGAGASDIKVFTMQNGDWATVKVEGANAFNPLGRSERFFERSLALCGGLMQTAMSDEGFSVEIEFSALGEELSI